MGTYVEDSHYLVFSISTLTSPYLGLKNLLRTFYDVKTYVALLELTSWVTEFWKPTSVHVDNWNRQVVHRIEIGNWFLTFDNIIFLFTSVGVSKVTSIISCKVLQFNYITAYVHNYQLMFFVLEHVFSCSVDNSDRGSWFQCCLIGYLIMLYQQQRVFVIKWNERKNRCNEP